MKKIIGSIFLVVVSVVAYAQIEIGPRVGLGTVYTDVSTTSDEITSGDAEFGFSVGFFTRIGSERIKLMPELLYSTSTMNVVFNEDEVGEQVTTSELDRIDIPVAIQFKPIYLLNFQGGLVASYLIEENTRYANNTEQALSNFEDFTLGYQFGAGLELGNFLIDLRYESSLSDITDAESLGALQIDERQETIKGMLGIKLF